MLDGLRSSAGGFVAKLLLALLVLSFAVWGIGDMVQSPGRNVSVATVGGTPISLRAFEFELRQEAEKVRAVLGDRYSPEMLKNLGLHDLVLRRLINDELMKRESEALGLIPSDVDVARRIRTNYSFQDKKGNFDKTLFQAMLRNNNMSEKTYVEQLRRDMASNLLMETLAARIPAPPGADLLLYQARNQQRNAVLYTLGRSALASLPQPKQEQLESYYEQHKQEFALPEYREISYLAFKSQDVHLEFKISEENVQNAYKERIEEFKRPERRVVQQLLYENGEQAKKAYDLLQIGTSFEQLAKTTPISNKGAILLGAIERSHIVKEAEDAVFSLHTNEYTQPIESSFGWHIFRVSKIEESSIASYEEVHDLLVKDLKAHAADDALGTLAASLEDKLAGGASLQEAAADFGLKVKTLGPFNQRGMTPEGKPADLPKLDKFIEVAFKTDAKAESPLTSTRQGSYYLIRVDNVIPERLRSLDEVKAQVVSGWQKEQQEQRLGEMAVEVAQKMADKGSRDALIAKYNLTSTAASGLKQTSKTTGDITLPEPLLVDLFTVQPGQSTGAYRTAKGEYIIAVLRDVIPAAAPAPDAKPDKQMLDIRQELSTGMQNELISQYLTALAEKYPVSMDARVLDSLKQNVEQR